MRESRRLVRQQSKDAAARERCKVLAGVAEMARELGDKAWCNGEGFSLADIAVGCALGYLELRLPDVAWRAKHPGLARLAEKLAKRASFLDSIPPAG